MSKIVKKNPIRLQGLLYAEKAAFVLILVTFGIVFSRNFMNISGRNMYNFPPSIILSSIGVTILMQLLIYPCFIKPAIEFGISRKKIFVEIQVINLLYIMQTCICITLVAFYGKTIFIGSRTEGIVGMIFIIIGLNQIAQLAVSALEKSGRLLMAVVAGVGIVMFAVTSNLYIYNGYAELVAFSFVIIVGIVNTIYSYGTIMQCEIK